MIKIAICDDSDEFTYSLENMIKSYGERNNIVLSIKTFNSSIMLAESLKMDFQVFFLDIEMPLMDGVELARLIRKYDSDSYLVFVTSYMKYMPIGYDVNASNYLRKPIKQAKVDKELDKIVKWFVHHKKTYITVKNLEGFFKIYLHELKYIETYDRNVLIHTEKGNIICYKKMQELDELLKNDDFYRCHNSYIVNLNYIERIVGLKVYLLGGEIITTTKARKKELLIKFAESI